MKQLSIVLISLLASSLNSMDNNLKLLNTSLRYMGKLTADCASEQCSINCLPPEIKFFKIIKKINNVTLTQKQAHESTMAYLSTCKEYASYLNNNKEAIIKQIMQTHEEEKTPTKVSSPIAVINYIPIPRTWQR